MLTEYIFLNLGRMIVGATLYLLIVFLCIFITSKIFIFSVDYASVFVGAGVMLVIFEVNSYIKWLRSRE